MVSSSRSSRSSRLSPLVSASPDDGAVSSSPTPSAAKQEKGKKKKSLPVLIIPGFMSSGLEVRESSVSKSWVGKRVWINLQSLGFEKLFHGKLLHQSEKEGDRREYEEQVDCKNKWLRHMSLADDMVSERPGMKVRPIEGLAGVNYLTGEGIASFMTYVFGPVIDALRDDRDVGLTEKSLQAAPYDWRLPPSVLETRDKYFTNTVVQIENMYKANGNTPVVLLCHSLGCKTAHYLLNFALDKRGAGWLEKHIHTYMPVGAPHLGAPKSIRALVDGDKMGLDTLLSEEDALVLGRSLGSALWMVPQPVAAECCGEEESHHVFVRREASVEVTCHPIDCTLLLRGRRGNLPSMRLVVVYGKHVLMTEFMALSQKRGGKLIFDFDGRFVFPTANGEKSKRETTMQVMLQERGIQALKEEAPTEDCCKCCCKAITCILCCPFKYILCLPCTLVTCLLGLGADIALAGADATAKIIGAGTNICLGKEISLRNVIGRQEKAEVTSKMFHVRDKSRTCFKKRRMAMAKLELQWSPPAGAASSNSSQDVQCKIVHKSKKHVHYQPCEGRELFRDEEMTRPLHLLDKCYGEDRLGPRTRSAADAPPVKRVKAIYGVNLPTEIGAVYRRKARLLHKAPSVLEKMHVLDKAARGEMGEGQPKSVKDGIVLGTGDGTVPYWSLQHCKSWQGPCDVCVEELDGAEHREILADPRFHKILIDYIKPQT